MGEKNSENSFNRPTPSNLEVRSFLFRNVPVQLHRRWKLMAATLGVSMEEIALKGIDKYLKEELEKIAKEMQS